MTNYTRRDILKNLGSCLALASTPLLMSRNARADIDKGLIELRNGLYADSEEVLLARLIYGEARGVLTREKIAIAQTPINRSKRPNRFLVKSLNEAILSPKQFSCFNIYDPNFAKILNPQIYEPKAWKKSLVLSSNILSGKYDSSNLKQTHFHTKDMKKYPYWASKMKNLNLSEDFKHEFYR
jgi:spore germination cell wall hydrolase CwlJ-like protein